MTDTRTARPRTWTTLWYYPVVVLTFGLLVAIPFAHAAVRLRGRRARACAVSAVVYTAAMIAAVVVTVRFGTEVPGFSLVMFAVPLAAIVHLTFVRMQIASTVLDPTIDAVRAGRRTRARARRIVERDPAMARELRIGRPDLPRTFDDGGLVDLNSAPAAVIAVTCGLPPDLAEQLVAGRTEAGVPFLAVDDAFSYARVPVELWDRIRERAVVVP